MEWTVNGWVEHDGKGMPVDGDTLVVVWCRDGVCSGALPASDFLGDGAGAKGDWWIHQGSDYDIISYKVEEEHENPS